MKKPEFKNPGQTVDVIIEMPDSRIVLIERKFPPKSLALPGGYVEYGEPLWDAAVREVQEETSLRIELIEQFYTYSDPMRVKGRHVITTVFLATGYGTPTAGDDALAVRLIDVNLMPQLAFDHNQIVDDYLIWKSEGLRPSPIASLRSTDKNSNRFRVALNS
ncbi:MAG: NUDIX hydrolase [Bdellovibrionales bacterium]|nr:NUDIX hydrolase [Bdellovibrionales bacterium]